MASLAYVIKAEIQELSRLTEALSEMHRSALPNVVRGTLNDLAFETRAEIPESAKANFVNRTKTFFKANSRVKKAEGYDLNGMVSEAGIIGKDKATKGLEAQEKGGKIEKTAFIPLDGARVSKSHEKKIAKRNRLSDLRIINAGKRGKGPKKQRLIRAVASAKGTNTAVLFKGTVFAAKNIRDTKKGLKFRLVPLYDYSKGRSSRVKATHFVEEAAEKTLKGMGRLYKENFNRQVKKLKQKNRL